MNVTNAEPDLAWLASSVGDPCRIQMLALLMKGRALTAKELALYAGIMPATASSHLKRLLDDGLLASTSQGRHKYFRLASEQVAHLVESLMRVAPLASLKPSTPPSRSARPAIVMTTWPAALARACWPRCCARAGWSMTCTLPRTSNWTSRSKAITALGIDLADARARRRQFACHFLEWSERRDHLGGALGAALAEPLLAERWIERKKHSRVVLVTDVGRARLAQLGLRPAG